jgi:hypothetical protein
MSAIALPLAVSAFAVTTWMCGRENDWSRTSSSPLVLRVGKEQLLTINLVAGDRGLTFR